MASYNEIKAQIAGLIKLDGVSKEEIISNIATPNDLSMGDYALPCFKFAKQQRKSPKLIAEEIVENIGEITLPLKGVEAVNGYVNFKVDKLYTAKEVLAKILKEKNLYGNSSLGNDKTICIDYSSINIAKPFHIGHLSTTVIGGALYRLYKKLGYNVVGINHLGDWGTQFGKLIYAFLKWGNRESLDKNGMSELTKLYVKYHKEADKDKSLDDYARAWFRKIEDKDAEAIELFNLFKEITLKEVDKIYNRLNIHFDSYNGDAFYNDKMDIVIEELEKANLLEDSEGAKLVNLEEFSMAPCLIKKADGASLYATRDLAAAFYRKKTYDFYKCLYVVAYQQNLHFKQFFKVLELLKKDWAKDLIHVQFGMVSLEEGTMSTRQGKVVLLEDVLNKAVKRSQAIIAEKNPDLEDKEEIAEMVGVGAVVFSALSNNRIKDIVFSYDKVLNFDGETGPYIQYTVARCNSVIAKDESFSNALINGDYTFKESDYAGIDNYESEVLIDLLQKYQDVLIDAGEKYEPSFISRHLVDIAQAFNKFYYERRILVEKGLRETRLALVIATKYVLEEGLSILGIKSPKKM